MQVTKIGDTQLSYLEELVYAKPKTNKTEFEKTEMQTTTANSNTSWKKDILMQGLEKLEKNLHLDNSHPLDRAGREPIESFPEAVIELSFLKTPKFTTEAFAAQANIRAESVASLFAGESIF
jgi:hypothetical protein